MSETRGALAKVLGPILDTYLNCPIAITGCNSYNIARDSCELDIIVVTEERKPSLSTKVGSNYIDIYFMEEREIMSPSDPEIGVSLAHIVPVRDSSWVLSMCSSTNKALLESNMKKSSEQRLSLALKGLSRAYEALSNESAIDSSFWLLYSGYQVGFSFLYSRSILPCPSHLLQQMKDGAKGNPEIFDAFSSAIGVEQSSRLSCLKRIDAISILYDILHTMNADVHRSKESPDYTSYTSFEIVKNKASSYLDELKIVDSFSFLGLVTVTSLLDLLYFYSTSKSIESDFTFITTTLSKGEKRLISQDVLNSLSLVREEHTLKASLGKLHESVSSLAKRI